MIEEIGKAVWRRYISILSDSKTVSHTTKKPQKNIGQEIVERCSGNLLSHEGDGEVAKFGDSWVLWN